LHALSLDEFKEHSSAVQEDVYDCLGVRNVVQGYVSAGAAGAEQARQQLTYWKKRLAQR